MLHTLPSAPRVSTGGTGRLGSGPRGGSVTVTARTEPAQAVLAPIIPTSVSPGRIDRAEHRCRARTTEGKGKVKGRAAGMTSTTTATLGRWRRRPRLARGVRVAGLRAAPVVASFAAAVLRPHRCSRPRSGSLGRAPGYLLVLVAVSHARRCSSSTGSARRAAATGHAARPQHALPGRAPSRLKVAREAIKPPADRGAAGAGPRGRRRPRCRRPRDPHPGRGAQRPRPARPAATPNGCGCSPTCWPRSCGSRSGTATCCGGRRSCTTSASCGCRPTLLNKPGKPTDEEWDVLKAHPAHGAEIAAALLPWLGEWGDGDRPAPRALRRHRLPDRAGRPRRSAWAPGSSRSPTRTT